MYGHPKHLLSEADTLEALRAFNRVATLITHGASGLNATHLPLIYDPAPAPYGRFLGHMARANPHWKDAEAGAIDALVLLPGAETYVSPAWYETKKRDPRVVPTWNYETLHVRGRLNVHMDTERLRENVSALSDRHEAGRAAPWTLADAPADYIARLLNALVGVELLIERVEGKRKLSQDKREEDRAGVRAALDASSDPRAHAIAKAMRDA